MTLTRYNDYWTPTTWPNPFRNDFGHLVAGLFDQDQEAPARDFYPKMDIIETNDAYVVRAELPGMTKEQIKLEVKGNTLAMSGEKRLANQEAKANYQRIETGYGRFSRSFTLPVDTDGSKISAKSENGLLTVTLPKSEAAKNQTIRIQ